MSDRKITAEEWQKYLDQKINPFAPTKPVYAESQQEADEAVMGALETGANRQQVDSDIDNIFSQQEAAMQEVPEMEPSETEEDQGLTRHQDIIEQRAQARFPSEATPVIEAEETVVEVPEQEDIVRSFMMKKYGSASPQQQDLTLPTTKFDAQTSDVPAAQAEAAIENIKTPFEPSQSNAPGAELTANDSERAQENAALEAKYKKLKETDPTEYVRLRYGSNPDQDLMAEKEMRADTSYENLKNMQRRTGIMDALSGLDTSLGQLEDYKTLEARKAGYTGSYKGGAFGSLAKQQREDFEGRRQYTKDEAERQKAGLEQEKKGQEFLKAQKDFEILVRDDKEMNDPNSSYMAMLGDMAAKHYGLKDLPPGTTPKKLLTVLPQMKDFVVSEMAQRNALELQRQKHLDALELQRLKDESDAKAKADKDKDTFKEKNREKAATSYAELQDSALKVDNQMDTLDDALSTFTDYTRGSTSGTGPLATLGGMTKYFSSDTEKLDNKFKKISIDSMVNMFQGMSKAIDSNTERAAFNATQPSITNDDPINAEILLGGKAILLKTKAEAAAQKEWLDTHPNLDDYQSPVIGKVTSVVDKDGNVMLVPKQSEADYIKNGFYTIDDYAQKFILKSPSKALKQRPSVTPSESASPNTKVMADGSIYEKVEGGWKKVK